MARPQTEDGHIRIANEIYRAAIRLLGPVELKVWSAVVDRTYGWRRKEAPISFRELSEATGLDRRRVIRCVQELVSKNVLRREERRFQASLLAPNKDWETWLTSDTETTSDIQTTSDTETTSGSGNIDTTTSDIQTTTTSDTETTPHLITDKYKQVQTCACTCTILTRAFVDLYCAGAPRLPQIQKDAQRLSKEIPDFDELMAVTVLQVYHRNCFKPEEPIGRLIWFKQKIADYIASGKLPGMPSGNGHRGSSDLSRELMAQGLKPYVTQTATYYLDDSMQRKANTMAEWMLEQSLDRYAKQHPERVIVRG